LSKDILHWTALAKVSIFSRSKGEKGRGEGDKNTFARSFIQRL
jgi:hypothetical protein